MVKLIGISGRISSGKDLVARIIQYLTCNDDSQKYRFEDTVNWIDSKSVWQVKKFAGKVKEILSLLTGIPIEDFEKEEVKSSYLNEEWNEYDETRIKNWVVTTYGKDKIDEMFLKLYKNSPVGIKRITFRQALQMIGTDLFRDRFHPNTWVNALMKDIDAIYSFPKSIGIKDFSAPVLLGSPQSKQEKTDFRCSCGKVFKTTQWRVERGHTKSCGCYQKHRASMSSLKHGDSNTHILSVYKNMKTRCYNKKVEVYRKYGAKGITVCKEWLDDYNTFKQWSIWNGYSEELSLDRIDNQGNYSPENCRWVYPKDQSKNKEVYSNNNLGIRGVSYRKSNNKYIAQIQIEGKKIFIGYYDSIEEASTAYEKERLRLFNVKSPKKESSGRFIITDVRYENEAQAIKDRGGIVIRVNRRELEVMKIQKAIKETGGYMPNEHSSETSLDSYNFDYVIENDSDIPSLIEKVREMLIHFKVI